MAKLKVLAYSKSSQIPHGKVKKLINDYEVDIY
jgi:hypothetical protein